MNGLRHQAFYLPTLAFMLSLMLSTLTRLGLMLFAWPNIDHGLKAIFLVFAYGAVADLLFASALAGLLLVFTAITHTRWPTFWLFNSKRLIAVFVLSAFLLFVAISEFVFWNEFGARFNFVAVDYLLYTNEVIGNIRESYSLPAVMGGMCLGAGLITVFIYRYWPLMPAASFGMLRRISFVLVGALSFYVLGLWSMNYAGKHNSQNQFNQELAHNGPASFFLAARENELDFSRYYRTLPEETYRQLAPIWPDPSKDQPNPTPLHPKHIVLIEIESLSASFMASYGNQKEITPNLDRLMHEGIWFSNLYATGTRTVRGLEGMSAALPPLPGQSIVRRTNNTGLYTLGSMLQTKGFDPMFMYGGYGAFDNMNAYFQGNGYKIRDRQSFSEANQSFATVWGVADELMFNEALMQLDHDTKMGQPRFLHIMTTSNHRPYTYPSGRINIPSKTGRDGAVKYTDWAIGHFLEQAKSKPWFADTLFIIVADHNASVAGKQSLPPNKYLIPAVLYWPGKLAPQRIAVMSSQIDLTPTVLALLGIRTGGVFFGQNLLTDNPEPRAFLVNYQELGYLTPTDDGLRNLIILGPKKRVDNYSVNADGDLSKIPANPDAEDRAIALFQKTHEVYSSGLYRANASDH
jgi:phosphoglycerol transferase MdoB-like AlkP superfamily enzyme